MEEESNRSPNGDGSFRRILEMLRQLKVIIVSLQSIWRDYQDSIEERSATRYFVAVMYTHKRRGRPKFAITGEQLEYLRSLSFTWDTIASLLGVSQMTIYQRCQEYELVNEPMQHLSDNELESVVRNLQTYLPCSGESILLGAVWGMGYAVCRRQLSAMCLF